MVVCDGFVGNVALKTSEGLAKMIVDLLKQEFRRNIFTKMAGMAAAPVMHAFKKRIDSRRYNGASLLGLRGVVVTATAGRTCSPSSTPSPPPWKRCERAPRRITEQVSLLHPEQQLHPEHQGVA